MEGKEDPEVNMDWRPSQYVCYLTFDHDTYV
jgi:hypothetical protein